MSVQGVLQWLLNRLHRISPRRLWQPIVLRILAALLGFLSKQKDGRTECNHGGRKSGDGNWKGWSACDPDSGNAIVASRQPTSVPQLLSITGEPRSSSPESLWRHRGALLDAGYLNGEVSRVASQSAMNLGNPYRVMSPNDSRSVSTPHIPLQEMHRRGEDIPVEGHVMQTMHSLAIPPASHSRPHSPARDDNTSIVSIVVTDTEHDIDEHHEGGIFAVFSIEYGIETEYTGDIGRQNLSYDVGLVPDSVRLTYVTEVTPNSFESDALQHSAGTLQTHRIYPIDTSYIKRYSRNMVVYVVTMIS
jgi:hypothetical protein